MNLRTRLAATAALLTLAVPPAFAPAAFAHVVVGARTFPVTLTFDDPGVGDEVTLPQFVWQRSAGPTNDYQLQWEYDKRITETTALIYNHGYDFLQSAGAGTRTGFENIFITGKWQALTFPAQEAVVSFGVIRELSGTAPTVNVGGDLYGSTAPTIYFGKGFGDLPIGDFRPLAITGEASYVIPDRRQNADGSNNGSPLAVNAAISLQYDMPYLQANVHDYGLPDFLNRLIPLVELSYKSPVFGPAAGNPATWQIAPGFIYAGDVYQVGVEALIPGNKAAGQNVGVIVQLHFFLDDILPDSLGKPVSQW